MSRLPIDRTTSFGKIVRVVRLSRGLTQLELGNRLGVSNTIISYIERGRNHPSKVLLERMWDFVNEVEGEVDETVFRITYDVTRGRVDLKGLSTTHQLLTARLASSRLSESQIELLNKFLNGNVNHESVKTRKRTTVNR